MHSKSYPYFRHDRSEETVRLLQSTLVAGATKAQDGHNVNNDTHEEGYDGANHQANGKGLDEMEGMCQAIYQNLKERVKVTEDEDIEDPDEMRKNLEKEFNECFENLKKMNEILQRKDAVNPDYKVTPYNGPDNRFLRKLHYLGQNVKNLPSTLVDIVYPFRRRARGPAGFKRVIYRGLNPNFLAFALWCATCLSALLFAKFETAKQFFSTSGVLSNITDEVERDSIYMRGLLANASAGTFSAMLIQLSSTLGLGGKTISGIWIASHLCGLVTILKANTAAQFVVGMILQSLAGPCAGQMQCTVLGFYPRCGSRVSGFFSSGFDLSLGVVKAILILSKMWNWSPKYLMAAAAAIFLCFQAFSFLKLTTDSDYAHESANIQNDLNLITATYINEYEECINVKRNDIYLKAAIANIRALEKEIEKADKTGFVDLIKCYKLLQQLPFAHKRPTLIGDFVTKMKDKFVNPKIKTRNDGKNDGIYVLEDAQLAALATELTNRRTRASNLEAPFNHTIKEAFVLNQKLDKHDQLIQILRQSIQDIKQNPFLKEQIAKVEDNSGGLSLFKQFTRGLKNIQSEYPLLGRWITVGVVVGWILDYMRLVKFWFPLSQSAFTWHETKFNPKGCQDVANRYNAIKDLWTWIGVFGALINLSYGAIADMMGADFCRLFFLLIITTIYTLFQFLPLTNLTGFLYTFAFCAHCATGYSANISKIFHMYGPRYTGIIVGLFNFLAGTCYLVVDHVFASSYDNAWITGNTGWFNYALHAFGWASVIIEVAMLIYNRVYLKNKGRYYLQEQRNEEPSFAKAQIYTSLVNTNREIANSDVEVALKFLKLSDKNLDKLMEGVKNYFKNDTGGSEALDSIDLKKFRTLLNEVVQSHIAAGEGTERTKFEPQSEPVPGPKITPTGDGDFCVGTDDAQLAAQRDPHNFGGVVLNAEEASARFSQLPSNQSFQSSMMISNLNLA